MPFWPFLRLLTFFCAISIILTKTTFLKLKQDIFFNFFIVDPQKSLFIGFETKNFKTMLFIFFFCFSFKNYKRTNVVLVNIFENALQKVSNCQYLGGSSSKTKNAPFWGSKLVVFKTQISNLFFCVCYFM